MDISSININFWVLQSLAMILTALILPGLRITSPLGAVAAVVALAFVNAHVWDAALFFSIPDNLSSQALLLILSNGAIFWVIVKILPGIEVSGLLSALAAPIIFTILSLIISTHGKDIDWIGHAKSAVAYVSGVRDELREGSPVRGSNGPHSTR